MRLSRLLRNKIEFSHLKDGKLHMVDITHKMKSIRYAAAQGKISMSRQCFDEIKKTTSGIESSYLKKGDIFSVATVAGIQAAKMTPSLIPLCHQINLTHIELDFELNEDDCAVSIRSECKCSESTGVEMEALTAVSVAALTVYDMCKAIDKNMVISDIKLIQKTK
jgi:cyclic pyranopterin phosphate synthase